MTSREMRAHDAPRRSATLPFMLLLMLTTGLIAPAWLATPAVAQTLRGSAASLDRQNAEAAQHDFTFLQGPTQLRRFVGEGLLVGVENTADYWLKDVSFPYTRPEVKIFIDRLAAQYREACGERLVVTSLTRPISHQPRNASPRSVHPTGMALDLRRPRNPSCRRWLETTLLYLEEQDVLDATHERSPPHYHVALFPRAYASYVAGRTEEAPAVAEPEVVIRNASAGEAETATVIEAAAVETGVHHTVRRNETLWTIARRYGTTPERLRAANRLTSSLIHPGLRLTIPSDGEAPAEHARLDPAAPGGMSHVVERRETLWDISQRYGTTPERLRATNGLTSSLIHPGLQLTIPTDRTARGGLSHIVERRETLWDISRRYGTTPAQIRRVNRLRSSVIHPGQQLTIPVEPLSSQ